MTVVGRVDVAHAYRQAKACAQKAIELDESLMPPSPSPMHFAIGIWATRFAKASVLSN
jgi:hypothetical protein